MVRCRHGSAPFPRDPFPRDTSQSRVEAHRAKVMTKMKVRPLSELMPMVMSLESG